MSKAVVTEPCECTKVQQDETCPVGCPSLLCDVCDGKGHVPLSHGAEAVEPEQKPVAWISRNLHDPETVWLAEPGSKGNDYWSTPFPVFAHPVRYAQEAVLDFDDEVIAYAQEIVDDREANGCKVYVSDVVDALRAALSEKKQ